MDLIFVYPSSELVLYAISIPVLYLFILGVKRLYFDPLSQFPGPKLAALSLWYETYYDAILPGKYNFKIKELHEEYNSGVIRINPRELHFSDPDFFPEIFTGAGRRRDIDFWSGAAFLVDKSHFTSVSHDLHRARRAPLEPFFSITNIRKLQPVIEERVDKFIERIREFGEKKDREVLNCYNVFSALSNDVVSQYSFGQCNRTLEHPDFNSSMTKTLESGLKNINLMRHFPLVRRFVETAPEGLVVKIFPFYGPFIMLKKVLAQQIESIRREKEKSSWSSDHETIFAELLDSSLPPEEKTPERLAHEGRSFVFAGSTTTTWALSVALFHLLNQPKTLHKLREELFTAMPDPSTHIALVKLEQLPYLTGCVKESLRLSFGATARLPRIPVDEELIFNDKKTGKTWTIPKNVKCSMTTQHILIDPTIFESPYSFIPERWVDDQEARKLEKYYVPFAKGTRNCLGKNLANAELYLTLGKFFRLFGGPESKECEGRLRLFETTERDVEFAHDFFTPFPWQGSKGVRVTVEKV